jgi:hypothetical protein
MTFLFGLFGVLEGTAYNTAFFVDVILDTLIQGIA